MGCEIAFANARPFAEPFFDFEVVGANLGGSLVYLCVRGCHTHFLKCFERRRVRRCCALTRRQKRKVSVFEKGGVPRRVSSPCKPVNDLTYRVANLKNCFRVLVPLLTGVLFDQPNCRRNGAQQIASSAAK